MVKLTRDKAFRKLVLKVWKRNSWEFLVAGKQRNSIPAWKIKPTLGHLFTLLDLADIQIRSNKNKFCWEQKVRSSNRSMQGRECILASQARSIQTTLARLALYKWQLRKKCRSARSGNAFFEREARLQNRRCTPHVFSLLWNLCQRQADACRTVSSLAPTPPKLKTDRIGWSLKKRADDQKVLARHQWQHVNEANAETTGCYF